MSSSNKVFKVAQLLLNQSIGENGRIDSEKVSAILNELRENPPLILQKSSFFESLLN